MILGYLLDTPLSAIGDTLTLPITVGEALGWSLPPWPDPGPGYYPGEAMVVPVQTLPPPRPVGPPPTAYQPVGR